MFAARWRGGSGCSNIVLGLDRRCDLARLAPEVHLCSYGLYSYGLYSYGLVRPTPEVYFFIELTACDRRPCRLLEVGITPMFLCFRSARKKALWNEEEEEWVVVEAEEHVDPENYIPHLQSRRLLRRQSSLGMSHSLSVHVVVMAYMIWPRHIRAASACLTRSRYMLKLWPI